MKKVGILSHHSDFEKLGSRLAELGVIQISSGEEKPAEVGQELEHLLSRITRAINFLDSKTDKEPSKLKLSFDPLAELVTDFDIEKALSKIETDRQRLEKSVSRVNTLTQIIENLRPYESVPYRLDELTDSPQIGIRPGFLPKDFEISFPEKEQHLAELVYIKEYKTGPHGKYIMVVYHRSIEDAIDQILADSDFALFHPGELTGTPSEEISKATAELNELKKRILETERVMKVSAEELLPILYAIRGYLKAELNKKRLSDIAEKTEQTLYLTGWVKAPDISALRKSLSKDFDAVMVEPINPAEGESPPVALKNPPVIEAFEIITDLYGRPRPGMVDPTPFIAPFFPVFFALCLTDAGYGLLISLLGAGFLLFGNLGKGSRKFMRFILYSGITTIIIGALAGGWFGMNLSASNNVIAKALLSVKLFDPLSNAIEFFAASIFLGVIQVSVGFGISGYVGAKEAPNAALRLKAILMSAAWIAVTLGAGIFIANYLIPEATEPFLGIAVTLLKYGAIGIIAVSIILGIAGKRGIGGSIADGIGFDGLYGIVGLFGDLLSYARILALGLSTGVIAGVINIIAKQLSVMIPGVGFVFAALLVIIGHIVYTGISALGAFVHPARLHFVEYFTKFYEGGGEPFEPFERKIEGVETAE